MPSSVEKKAAAIEAIIFDVDGVLTSGAIVYGPEGEWKIFNVQDGHGFKMAARAGLKLGVLTGRSSAVVDRRMKELGVEFYEQGAMNKGEALPRLLRKMKVNAGQTCYVGDDVIDLPPMRLAGLSVAVANAVDEVKAAADAVTARKGGEGAVREVIELVMRARGLWEEAMKRYTEDAE